MDDSISRQAAIDIVQGYAEQLQGYIGMPNDSEVYAYARGLLLSIDRNINNLPSAQQTTCKYWDDESSFCALHKPSAQPEQRWIPCSERLSDEEVLCCDTRGEMIIGYPYPDEESNTGFSAESDDVFMIDCAAWMPLPEPYKEDKE